MKIIEKLIAKKDIHNNPPVTIAFLGDSVTHGCFECWIDKGDRLDTIYDPSSAYSLRLREILNILYPTVQVNIINSGICGDSTTGSLGRLQRDILRYCPDLVVVSLGLNDCCNPDIPLPVYTDNLRNIFTQIRADGAEVIFLTQNYMNTYISYRNPEPLLRNISALHMQKQNEGDLKAYMEAASAVAAECGAKVCDLYSVWEKLERSGVDTTELLANKINHPIREFHYYMAIKLLETMMEI